MKRLLLTTIGGALLLLLAAGPSAAAGPDDGLWFVTQTNATVGISSFVLSLHQNGNNVAIVLLYFDGTWQFGTGTRSGDQINGGLHTSEGGDFGTFSITLSGSTLSGGTLGPGVFFALSGSRLF